MKPLFSLCVILLALSACNESGIIQHEVPDLHIDDSFFVDSKCYNDLSCAPPSMIDFDPKLESLNKPSDLLGGLKPTLPIAVLSYFWFEPLAKFEAVYVKSCLGTDHVRYLVVVDEKVQLVDSIEKLTHTYAPIESQEEALSFAIAATGYSAKYDLESVKDIRLYADPVEETFVSTTEHGYSVHLFDTLMCGCGPYVIPSVDVIVNNDGTITIINRLDAYSDPAMDHVCAD